MIAIESEAHLQLTTFVCTGTPVPAEIESELATFYAGTPTLHTIWEFSGADLTALTAEKISLLAGFLKETSHSREGGRSALVFSMNQLVDLTDRLPSLAELEVHHGTIKIFSGLEKARAWTVGESAAQ